MNAGAIPLGPFRVDEPLGRGGMGEVWAGVHAAQGVPVAVKVLTADWTGDEAARARLRDEVEAVAALDHPGIVLVLDFGRIEAEAERLSEGRLRAGSPYLVMERADRGTLRDTAVARTWTALRDLLLALLDALAHAHARGVVHRDVKPSNVLLFSQGRRLRVKLCDFGLAYVAGRARAGGPRSEASSGAAGTPWFMAPEQVDGAFRDYGPWTDLYALGCLGWALATGRPLFADLSPRDVLTAQREVAPPALAPLFDVPAGLEEWLCRLLAKPPEARFQRAADAAFSLRRLDPWPARAPGSGIEEGHEALWLGPEDAATADELAGWTGSTLDVGPVPITPGRRASPPGGSPPPPTGSAQARLSWSDAPPFPPAWRQGPEPRPPLPLQGAGLGLWGLRSLPLVGRHAERDALWRALGQVHARRRARAVSLEGPAGHGKSRLASWLTQRAHELGAAHVLRAVHGPIPGPADGLPRLVAQHLACEGLEGSQLVARVEAQLLARGCRDEGAHRALAALASADPGHLSPGERHDAVRALVDALARERPVVLVIEDAQWGADALAFALDLLRRDEPRPALVVLTVSDEALAGRALEAELLRALYEQPECARLTLPALERDERQRLADALLPLEPALAARLVARTGGNPLFAVQLLGDWVARGLLHATPAGFALPQGVEPPLPDDLHAVWRERLAGLGGEENAAARQVLGIAAALGLVIEGDEWRAACAAAGFELPSNLVDAMVAARLARRTAGGFTFVNAMLRDSLEREAHEDGRWADCNRACAGMLLLRPARAGHAERLGRHLLAAGEPAAAVEPLLRGARERRESSEYGRAQALLIEREHALDASGAPAHDPRRAEGFLLRSRIHLHEARLDDAARWARQAEAQAEREGWPVIHGEALRLLGDAERRRGDLERAGALYRAAIALEPRCDDPHAIAASLWGLGDVLRQRGASGQAASCFARSRELYERIDDRHGVADHLIGSADLARQRGDLEGAAFFYGQAQARFEDLGNRYGVARSLNGLGEVARARGDLATAEERYRRSAALLELIRSSEELFPRVNLGFLDLLRGRFDQGQAHLHEAAQRLARLDWGGPLACALLALGACAAARGEWRLAAERLEEGAARLAATGQLDPDAAWAAELGARHALAAGQAPLARLALRVALHQARGLGQDARAAALGGELDTLGEKHGGTA